MATAKILLVDDVKVFLEFERPFFERAGCSIITARSGPEALRLVREERPNVVLLDYEMPGMNGDEVCRQIKEDSLTQHIPVLIVTSHPTPEISERCQRAGCTDFIAKPVTGKDLLQKVVQILQMPYRVHLRSRVSMEVSLGVPGESVAVIGYSENVSEGGMLVETPEPIEDGQQVKVSFSLPDSGDLLSAVSDVIRVTHLRAQGMFSVALRFAPGESTVRESIRAFVDRELAR